MDAFRSLGPLSAAELQEAVGTSRSSLQRTLARERADVLAVGRARATRYAGRRAIDHVRTPMPVYALDDAGQAALQLTMHPVEPCGFYIEGHVPDVESGFHGTRRQPGGGSELPWFLQDLKPSGFLGRAWVRAHRDGGVPADLQRWTADDVVRYAALYGADLPGAWVLGDFARELLARVALPEPLPPDTEAAALPALAERALTDALWGSSLGGEQPKFVVRRGGAWCLVKFSPLTDTAVGVRWADLLAAEHVAHGVLAEVGVPSCRSELIDAGGRRFLVTERFDRVGLHGRRGVCSLGPLDSQGVAFELRSWSLVSSALARDGRLEEDVHTAVAWVEAFGHLIANTDMHPGNLAFFLQGTRMTGLAPIYDMLPMFHAPRFGGEIHRRLYDPRSERSDFPSGARQAAAAFWEAVQGHSAVSADFSAVARAQLALV